MFQDPLGSVNSGAVGVAAAVVVVAVGLFDDGDNESRAELQILDGLENRKQREEGILVYVNIIIMALSYLQ